MSMTTLIRKELNKFKNPEKAKIFQRFFKTGKGEYGEGDIFLGLTVPQQREVANKYTSATLEDLQNLLSNKFHEERLVALLMLIAKYKKENQENKKKLFEFYLRNTKNINNWDLVDLSAPNIVGDFLLDKDKTILYDLAKSKNLWEKRISIISTMQFIRNNKFEETLRISEILLKDKHDLIHKAVGWMLRELGKKNIEQEEKFLKKFSKKMPRTMLRYSIEKFPEEKRRFYLGNKD